MSQYFSPFFRPLRASRGSRESSSVRHEPDSSPSPSSCPLIQALLNTRLRFLQQGSLVLISMHTFHRKSQLLSSQAMHSSGTDSYVMEKHCFCSLQELRLPFVASLRQDLRDGAGWGGRYGARLRGRCGPLAFPRSRSFSTRPGNAGTAAVANDEDMAASMMVANMAGIPNISKKNGRLYILVAKSGLLKRQAYLDVSLKTKNCVFSINRLNSEVRFVVGHFLRILFGMRSFLGR